MRKKLKKKINNLLQELEEDIKNLKESSKPVKPDVSLGRLTRMDQINQVNINLAALNNARLKQKKLLNALERIDLEDFGLCYECAEEIGEKRLLAAPWSTLCLNCAE